MFKISLLILSQKYSSTEIKSRRDWRPVAQLKKFKSFMAENMQLAESYIIFYTFRPVAESNIFFIRFGPWPNRM
jgi:hypothetical protein